MRRSIAMLVILGSTRAHAEPPAFRAHPTLALRAGVHGTYMLLGTWRDDYGSGDPYGAGFATELEAGVRLHPQWSATAFVDYARFSTELGYEYPLSLELHPYDSRFDELFVGGRVTWHPIARVFIGGGVAWSKVWQRNRPLDAGGEAFDEQLDSVVLQLTVGGELARVDRFGVQLSLGLAGAPFGSRVDERVGFYIPLLLGLAWE